MNIRPSKPDDIPALKAVLESTGLFPSELLPQMISGFLEDPSRGDLWLTCEADGEAVGFCYAVPEKLTDGTWNMLAIAVHRSEHGNGYGSALVKSLEDVLRSRECRVLIADTSGKDEFASTRKFYRRNGYAEEARIRDFWAAGDDKVVFWKNLLLHQTGDAAK